MSNPVRRTVSNANAQNNNGQQRTSFYLLLCIRVYAQTLLIIFRGARLFRSFILLSHAPILITVGEVNVNAAAFSILGKCIIAI